MIILEFRLVGAQRQSAALDEAPRIMQFMRNKRLRLRQDVRGTAPADLNTSCGVLAHEYNLGRPAAPLLIPWT
jgi:putative transposase